MKRSYKSLSKNLNELELELESEQIKRTASRESTISSALENLSLASLNPEISDASAYNSPRSIYSQASYHTTNSESSRITPMILKNINNHSSNDNDLPGGLLTLAEYQHPS